MARLNRIVFLVIFLVSFTIGVAAPVVGQSECDPMVDYMVEGASMMEANEYEAAIDAYTCALHLSAAPDDYSPVVRRIEAALLAGDYAQAYYDWHVLRNQFQPQESDVFTEIIADYSDAIEATPQDTSLYIFRSYYRWWEFLLVAALEDFEHILQNDPNAVYALLYRGSTRYYRSQRDLAEADFARALELAPDRSQIYFIIAATYSYNSQFEDGVEAATRGIGLGLEDPALYVVRANAYAGLGDEKLAATDYARHIAMVATETVEGGLLEPGARITVEIVPGQVIQLVLEAEAGQRLNVYTRGNPPVVDTVVVLLAPDGTPLAGNDDGSSLDASIIGYEATEDGQYRLLVTSYLGLGIGESDVRLTVRD